jgi:hypothetical protein
MTNQQLLDKQIQLQEEVQKMAKITLVTCGNCSTPFMHRMGLETVKCYSCGHRLDTSGCPDLFYKGCSAPTPEKPMLELRELDNNYFWNQRPKAVIMELSRHFDKVEDVSYINDSVPSIMINDEYQVYLPNGIQDGECECNKYGIIRDSELQEGNTDNFQWTQDIDRVIEIVEEMISDDKPIKRSEVLHRMRMITDDLLIIRQQFVEEELECSTTHAEDLYTHFNNIAIALDLDSDESLSWKLYSKGVKND